MREITIDGQQVRVKATPLALLYYRQAFGSDLIGSLTKLKGVEKDFSKFDSVSILQMIWAMAKADNGPGKPFPSFEKWLAGFDSADIFEPDILSAVMEEATEGFFRGGGKPSPGKSKRER